ncbi:type II toxin-antitoxin system RelE/ParE family toxin [Nostoc flagelliforme]|uniref:HigA, proteic killer suppression protein n=1 Tax=Nostoc flagelliforme CCNUN1 TaxID=2038116 RepID=A0A2K8T3H5_9NOSO|nr:type II toxin-antitoxin system RelE/ParE family toxin [Nostoc flagelliforme]AUB42244.1 higA, proteic killer suppression protein [Nostoc flagelliforme CCNUN1]
MGLRFKKVIKTFKHKGLRRLFEFDDRSGIQAKHAEKLLDILDRLDASSQVEDMRYPGSNLHQLKGDRKGEWSVTVSGNWRVTFEFENGDAYVVNYEDYH